MDDYKKMIRESVAQEIGEWIDRLKTQDDGLKLTRKWKVLFPRGFESGNNVLPVITGSKEGKRLIGEVSFILPEDLELDTEDLNLTLKNEPFSETPVPKVSPEPMEDSFDLLNRMVVSINEFLSGVEINQPSRFRDHKHISFFGTDAQEKRSRRRESSEDSTPTAAWRREWQTLTARFRFSSISRLPLMPTTTPCARCPCARICQRPGSKSDVAMKFSAK